MIGGMIRKRREELGLTQEELATKLGYKSKSTINKIEMGVNDITQSKIMLPEACWGKNTPSYLMGWENPDKSKDGEVCESVVGYDLKSTQGKINKAIGELNQEGGKENEMNQLINIQNKEGQLLVSSREVAKKTLKKNIKM